MVKVKLRIADVIIQMQSNFGLEPLTEEEQRLQISERFKSFFYSGGEKPDILVKVEIVERLPQVLGENIFITTHFEDKSENWRLLKKNNSYIYKSPLKDKKQLMLVNNTFDKVTAYLLPKKNKPREIGVAAISQGKSISRGKVWVWNPTDIIYDFLQVLLINYFALNKLGIFIHSIGAKDLDGKGLLFAGKSGCGKTTMAKLWHKHSKAMVLNDDRIIVRKVNGQFFIYGSPWHGEFSDYLASRIESAPLEKLFFIHHASNNTVRQISLKKAFNLLYPALFPTFWDKGYLENIVSFSEDLVKNVSCYSLGFVNDKRVIGFVRKI